MVSKNDIKLFCSAAYSLEDNDWGYYSCFINMPINSFKNENIFIQTINKMIAEDLKKQTDLEVVNVVVLNFINVNGVFLQDGKYI